ncbi:MAG: hypothetical protein Q8S21_05860 [Candidatus Paracaedibacteraceae bacterium]|nr:hypothetical protein [Candidatus Paracaedibacteraceae bacterium]
MIKKILCSLGTLFIFFLIYCLFALDASMYPICPPIDPSINQSAYDSKPQTVLVSYAAGHPIFLKNQNALVQSAAGRGFDTIHAYKRGHISPIFYQANKDVLDQPRGAGFWLWKSYFLYEAMKNYPNGTIIAYADSGIVFKAPITNLLSELKKYPIILTGESQSTPLRKHIKMETRKILNLKNDDTTLNDEHIWAFFLILENTPQTREVIKQWHDLCLLKGAITDLPLNEKEQDPDFSYFRHDEAILSIVASRHKDIIKIIPKPLMNTQYGVINFHRHPEKEFHSPLLRAAGIPGFISDILFNNYLMRSMRKQFTWCTNFLSS